MIPFSHFRLVLEKKIDCGLHLKFPVDDIENIMKVEVRRIEEEEWVTLTNNQYSFSIINNEYLVEVKKLKSGVEYQTRILASDEDGKFQLLTNESFIKIVGKNSF